MRQLLSPATMAIAVALMAPGCGASHHYFVDTNLGQLSPGWTKAQFLDHWSTRGQGSPIPIDQPVLRAAKRDEDSTLTEVFTLNMVSQTRVLTTYWFVFRRGVLEQWGRPEDWADVAARYDVQFNPIPGVSLR